ncbi:head morphogenesis protein [Rhizobium phage RHph_X3_2]|nr:head morphogenesis protein [Rhizobium phage RHph_X3_2]
MDIFDKEVKADELVTRWTRDGEDAFTSAVQELRDAIDVAEVERTIEQFDIPATTEAAGVDEDMFGLLEMVLWNAWIGAGIFTYAAFRSQALPKISLKQGHEAAAAFEQVVRPIIQGLVRDQQAVVVSTVLEGRQQGKRTREIALDLAGRYDNAAGKRVGSRIGLSDPWAQRIGELERALVDGDTAYLRKYLGWKTRDVRFDTWVKTRIDGGTLSPRQVVTILARTADRALYDRAKNVADDVVRSVAAASQTAFVNRLIQAGKIQAADLTKVWHHMQDKQVRFSHRRLGGQEKPIGESFVTDRGISIAHPHDPNAPYSERAGCRCWLEFRYKGKRIGRSGFRGF